MRTLQEELKCMREGLHYDAHTPETVSYTHQTLPTIA